MGGRLRCRIVGQERQGYLRGQLLEHHCGPGPVLGQDGPQLVRRCSAGIDHSATSTGEHSKFSSRFHDRKNPVQPLAIGPGVVSEHERVPSIRVCAHRPPAWPCGSEPCWFSHQNRVTSSTKQPNDDAVATLDRYRHLLGDSQLGQLVRNPLQILSGVEFPTDRGGRGLGGSGRWGGQFLVGDRGFQATVAVATDPVVAVDPGGDPAAGTGPGGEHGPVDDLGLEGGEERFGHGVVQA